MSGCCHAKKARFAPKSRASTEADQSKKRRRTRFVQTDNENEAPCLLDIENEPNKPKLETNQELQTKRLYERLEASYSMLQRKNYNGAEHEIELIQQNIHNDPLLEMKTWYLSALIYKQTGKTSRRKHAMNKLMKAFEAVQKDKRFINARNLRLPMQQLADIAYKAGEGEYEK